MILQILKSLIVSTTRTMDRNRFNLLHKMSSFLLFTDAIMVCGMSLDAKVNATPEIVCD